MVKSENNILRTITDQLNEEIARHTNPIFHTVSINDFEKSVSLSLYTSSDTNSTDLHTRPTASNPNAKINNHLIPHTLSI